MRRHDTEIKLTVESATSMEFRIAKFHSAPAVLSTRGLFRSAPTVRSAWCGCFSLSGYSRGQHAGFAHELEVQPGQFAGVAAAKHLAQSSAV